MSPLQLLTLLREWSRSIVARISWRMLNATGVGRRLDDLELGIRRQGGQRLRELYGETLSREHPRHLHAFEARVFSQHGEDGILLRIFAQIAAHGHGHAGRTFVEFGVQDGTECNTANLALNFGWRGLLLDGSAENVELGRAWYAAALGDRADAVRFERAWITAESIDETLRTHGVTGEIDLLSIDIDGNDYWVFEAIRAVSPRVVVIEYNASFGAERAVTVPYDPAFDRGTAHPSRLYHGASLAALASLAQRRGYRLVGCDSAGVNAFFVRDDVGGSFAALAPARAWMPHAARERRGWSSARASAHIGHLELVEVGAK